MSRLSKKNKCGLPGVCDSGTLLGMRGSIHEVLAAVKNECRQWPIPSVTVLARQTCSPFVVLISCIISLRTRDAVTAAASERLFSCADNPLAISALSVDRLADLIYPAGFYRTKATQIKAICERIVAEFSGRVPDTLDDLLTFPGVGRKTANLVVSLGYGKPGICVDVHVHRIVNRWGYVTARTPDLTEQALRDRLPLEYWIPLNDLLVSFGQHRCLPVTPRCSDCSVRSYCDQRGVTRIR